MTQSRTHQRPPKDSRNRLRQAGLLRTVAKRSRSDWPLVLAAWMLLACATTLITAAATYSESVAVGGYHRTIEASPAASSAVRTYSNLKSTDLPVADAALAPAIESILGPANGRVGLIASTDALSLAGYDASDQTHQILVGSYGRIEAHAVLVSGRWAAPEPSGTTPDDLVATAGGTSARPPLEATLSEGAAVSLGLKAGDRTSVTSKLDPARRIGVTIVGIWRPNADDRYWLGSGLELRGVLSVGTATTRGPFVVAEADLPLLAPGAQITAEWRWLPDIDSLQPSGSTALAAAITSLPTRLAAVYPNSYIWSESGLPDTLTAAQRSLLVAQSSSLLLFAQFAVLAVYAILLVAGMLVERRRPESALLRSRGAGSFHLAMLATGEALLLAIPAVAIAPFAAQAIVRLMNVVGPLAGTGVISPVGVDGTALAASIGAGVACVLVLALPALPAVGSLSGVRAAMSRQIGRTLAQRLGLDLIFAAIAVVAIWQLQLYGAPLTKTVRGDLGIDPLLVAAPAIGMLAGALLATRVVPRLGELGEKLVEHSPGLSAVLFARQLGRRPLRYTRLALLLMLAASLGTFAAAFASSWDRSQIDQAAYQTGADVRATISAHPVVPTWALGPLYAAVPGVDGAAVLTRTTFDVGSDVRTGNLLELDTAAMGNVPSLPPGAIGPDPNSAVASLAGSQPAQMIALPGTPTRLAVTLDADLTPPPGSSEIDPSPVPEGYLPRIDVLVSVVLADANGLHRFDGESVAGSSTGARVTIDLARTLGGVPYKPAYPLRLESVELQVASSNVSQIDGSFRIVGLDVSDAGGERQAIELPFTSTAWGWSRVDGQTVTRYEPAAGHLDRVTIGSGANDSPTLTSIRNNPTGAKFRFWAIPGGSTAIPAIASPKLLEATGARQGDTVLVSRSGFESPMKIVAVASLFPTLDPDKPFLLADRSSVELVDYATWGQVDTPNEWWLTVAPGRSREVMTTIGNGPYSAATVVDRVQLEDSGRADPTALGMIGALFMGSLAAAALAVIGFLVTVAFMARERSGESSLLRALGESRRGVVGLLTLESLAILAYGLLTGAALGLLIGWMAIPFAWLTPSGSAPVPAPSVIVPWGLLAAVALPIAVALSAGAVVLVRLATGASVAGTIRGQDVEP